MTLITIIIGTACRAVGARTAAGRALGLLAGVFNIVPYYGPLLVTGALALVGYLQSAPSR